MSTFEKIFGQEGKARSNQEANEVVEDEDQGTRAKKEKIRSWRERWTSPGDEAGGQKGAIARKYQGRSVTKDDAI